MACFVILACGTLGVGFFGNEEVKRGSRHMATAANDAVEIVATVQTQVHKLELSINATVTSGTRTINAIYMNHQNLSSNVRQDLMRKTKETLDVAEEVLVFYNSRDVGRKVNTAELRYVIQIFKEYTYYRWFGATASLCFLTLLCILLLLGIIRTSRCTLLLFCTFGIFSLVLCWVSAGAHLGSSVGIGDFCVKPHTVIEDVWADHADRDFLRYYTKCADAKVYNPFTDALQTAVHKVHQANDTLNSALTMALRFIPKIDLEPLIQRVYTGLSEAAECFQTLAILTDCTDLHKHYNIILNSFCHTSLFGLSLLAVSCAATGLLFSLLVIMASRAWRCFGITEREEAYPKPAEVSEDEGPFLPRPGPSAPVYGRYGAAPSPYGRPGSVHEDYVPYARGNAQVHLALQRQANPPPPYSATEFYHQYNDIVNPAVVYGQYGAPPPPTVRESNA
jgi:hypothetical protein